MDRAHRIDDVWGTVPGPNRQPGACLMLDIDRTGPHQPLRLQHACASS